MAVTLIVLVFVVGYAAIAFEHPLQLNKTASALLTGVLCWTIYAASGLAGPDAVAGELSHHLAGIAEILFFLFAAMTIVELIDAHDGFQLVTNRIKSRSSRKLLWILSLLTFFVSAALDNLTASIVMVSLLRKLIHDAGQRKFFAGIVIVAANAGGAWSPLGDVTTTMLWIGGQISATNIMKGVFLPSLVSLVVPLAYLSFRMKGSVDKAATVETEEKTPVSKRDGLIILAVGLSFLLFVPVFKTLTHLPPYIGMLLALGAVWVVSELLHKEKDDEDRLPLTVGYALQRIDSSSILFFLGILLAVSCLESVHVLRNLAVWMDHTIGNLDVIVVIIGAASAIIDNVPLVAAAMGMYDLADFPMDHKLWEFLAYAAGTGGSLLIIGSAAGVAVMGIEKIDFLWYLRKISLLALLGYLAGAGTYLLLYELLRAGN